MCIAVVSCPCTTRFEDDKMVSDLRTCGPDGDEDSHVEVWDLTGGTQFVGTLLRRIPDGP